MVKYYIEITEDEYQNKICDANYILHDSAMPLKERHFLLTNRTNEEENKDGQERD